MKTVQMTLEEGLVKEVDRLTKKLKTTRSAFARSALRLAIKRHHQAELEARHRQGYKSKAVQPGEFDVWETEQAWGDA